MVDLVDESVVFWLIDIHALTDYAMSVQRLQKLWLLAGLGFVFVSGKRFVHRTMPISLSVPTMQL